MSLLFFSYLSSSLRRTSLHLSLFWMYCFRCVWAFCWCLLVLIVCFSSWWKAVIAADLRRVTVVTMLSRWLFSRIFRSTVCLCHSAFESYDFAKTFAMLWESFSERHLDAQSTSTWSIRALNSSDVIVYTQGFTFYLFVVLSVIVVWLLFTLFVVIANNRFFNLYFFNVLKTIFVIILFV